MNKFLRFLGYTGVHILVIFEVYLLAILISSPIMCILFGIFDIIKHIPSFLVGRYFLAWLAVAFILWIPMYVYVLVKGKISALQK